MTRNKKDGKPASAGEKSDAPAKKKKVGPIQYLSQVRQEGRKVTWTPRNETLVSTVMVLILTLFAMLFFGAVDWLIGFVIRGLLGLGVAV